jgi:hypothetical protein
MDQSLEIQIAHINQRLSNIEKSIELLVSQTKSTSRVSDVVHIRGGTISSCTPSVSQMVNG